MENTKRQKLPLRVKFGFGSGNIYGGAINTYNFFYAIFMTDIIGLNAIYAGSVVLITQIWDAVTDPLMGYISDHTRSRRGRRRVYFLSGIVPIFISFVILWFPLRLSPQLAKYLYVLFGCLLFRTAYTMVMIPYQAMKAELSLDYQERSAVNLACMLFSSIAAILGFLAPMLLTNAFSREPRKAYMILAFGLGLIFALPWIGVYRSTRGRDRFTPTKKEPSSLKELGRAMVRPFGIRSFRVLAGIYIASNIALNMLAMTFIYFTKYCLPNMFDAFGTKLILPIGLALGIQFIAIPTAFHFSRTRGKSVVFLAGSSLLAPGLVLLFGLQATASTLYLCILGLLFGIGVSTSMLMLGSMQADLTDVGELYSGRREEGSFSGIYLFLEKNAAAFTQAALLFSLGLAGYVRPVERIVDGVRQSFSQPQPAAVYATIRLFMSIIPAILVLIAIALASQYPLDAQNHDKLNRLLEKRRAGQRTDPYSLAFLYRVLIAARTSLSYRIFRFCVKTFIPRYTVEGVDYIRDSAPCVLVANHLGPTGPMVTQLYLPIRHRPWAIDYTTQPRTCYRHLRDTFYREEMHFIPPFNIILAALTTLPCLWVMHGARAVPVYQGKKQIRKTFTKSVHTLLGGESVVIFPEIHDCPTRDGVKPFYPGFAHLGALHARIAGKSLHFHPVYIDKENKVVHIGSAVIYRADIEPSEETRRVAAELEEKMRELARGAALTEAAE